MNFELTEERQMLQDSLRRFLRDKYDTASRNAILASPAGFSDDIWAGLAEMGVLGALFTEDQGGFGGAGFDIAVVFEELGRAGVVEPVLDSALLGGGLVAKLGDEAQKALVEDVIGGGLHMAFAHGEPTSRCCGSNSTWLPRPFRFHRPTRSPGAPETPGTPNRVPSWPAWTRIDRHIWADRGNTACRADPSGGEGPQVIRVPHSGQVSGTGRS